MMLTTLLNNPKLGRPGYKSGGALALKSWSYKSGGVVSVKEVYVKTGGVLVKLA